MIRVGEFRIELVSDGIMRVDAGGPFGLVPRALYRKYFEPDAENTVPMILTSLLVHTQGKTVLIDTGLGDKMPEKVRQTWGMDRPPAEGLLADLAQHGVRPEDVDLVINTHLHNDHCAWNTRFNGGATDSPEVEATFPNADYLTQSGEFQDAMHPNERTRTTYFPHNYQPLVECGQMRLLNGDTEILPGLFGVITRGHTPHHMSIRFESQGQQALFVADMASYAVHFEKLAWMTAYDVEPLQTLETKRRWQQWALETGGLLIFQHDPYTRAGRLVRHDDRVQIVRLDVL